jgi:hypothetical protein
MRADFLFSLGARIGLEGKKNFAGKMSDCILAAKEK